MKLTKEATDFIIQWWIYPSVKSIVTAKLAVKALRDEVLEKSNLVGDGITLSSGQANEYLQYYKDAAIQLTEVIGKCKVRQFTTCLLHDTSYFVANMITETNGDEEFVTMCVPLVCPLCNTTNILHDLRYIDMSDISTPQLMSEILKCSKPYLDSWLHYGIRPTLISSYIGVAAVKATIAAVCSEFHLDILDMDIQYKYPLIKATTVGFEPVLIDAFDFNIACTYLNYRDHRIGAYNQHVQNIVDTK